MSNDVSMDTGLGTDPAVRQVVQSPANTSAERYDSRALCTGYDSETRHRLPAEERSSQRAMRSPVMVATVKLKSSRSGRSRR